MSAAFKGVVDFGSLRGGIGLKDVGREPRRSESLSGSFRASFHCCTLLTASSYLVGFSATTASVRLALRIHGCLRSFFADTRRLGSFWKHCIKKSLTAGD